MVNRKVANTVIAVFTAAWLWNLNLGWQGDPGFQESMNTILPGIIAGAFTIRERRKKDDQ